MNIEALVICLDFTIEDIYKIREWNYEQTKDVTAAEKAVIIIIRAKRQKGKLDSNIKLPKAVL